MKSATMVTRVTAAAKSSATQSRRSLLTREGSRLARATIRTGSTRPAPSRIRTPSGPKHESPLILAPGGAPWRRPLSFDSRPWLSPGRRYPTGQKSCKVSTPAEVGDLEEGHIMKFARSALVVVVASLGVAGGVAGGCGGDDDGGTTGTAGAGKGGTGGSGSTTSTTSTGGAGTTGGAGSGGAGSGGTGGMIDAGPSDADISACLMPESGVGTGSMCLDTCFCTTCPRQAQKCYNNADCVAII